MTARYQIASRPAHPWLALAVWIGVCLAAGGLGSFFTFEAVRTWYPTLQKPAWNPPAWVFGPVWTTLYVLMGTAAWRVWCRKSQVEVRPALRTFGVQLALNAAWSGLFFGMHAPGWAFLELLFLWAALLATVLQFRRLDGPSAWLLAPYLAWVTFAGVLNFTVWRLNG